MKKKINKKMIREIDENKLKKLLKRICTEKECLEG